METLHILALCLFGATLGSFINWFVDGFGWYQKYRSPWQKRPPAFPVASKWIDLLPIFGWISWKRVAPNHHVPGLESRSFWLRPLFVELFCTFGIVWLFYWEIDAKMLSPIGLTTESHLVLFLRFAVHILLFGLLIAATLIDFDDMVIPDLLTVLGTILALFIAAHFFFPILPITYSAIYDVGLNRFVELPNPVMMDHSANTNWSPQILWIFSSLLWGFWCFAMMNRIWYSQLPFKKAFLLFWRRLVRTPSTKWYFVAAILGAISFLTLQEKQLAGVYSALVGMATGMCLIWGVRLVGSAALKQEAMGFGDVTLMGMIGAFLGWQACVVIFFLAPFAGLLFGLVNLVLGKGHAIPYGPFLCLAAGFTIILWRDIWEMTASIFELGSLLGVLLGICLILLGILLGLWRAVKERLYKL
ncbi:MAG: prepilin peptidase [Thermoguttaceae bacterium]